MNMDKNVDQERAYANVIARVTVDPEFRAALIANPAQVMKAEGVEFPEGVEIEVLEATASKRYIVIPDKSVMGDELLNAAAGGGTASTMACAGSFLCASAPSSVSSAGSVGTATS